MDAIGTGDLNKVQLEGKDAALLQYVKLLTLKPSDVRDGDVEKLREVGWTDEQIWEASLEVSIFSFLNRMADAHGLEYPANGWYPPAMREQMEAEKAKEPGSVGPGTAAPGTAGPGPADKR